MLTQFFESAKTFVSTLTTDQLVAIFIAVLAISCAVKLIKTGLSVILSIPVTVLLSTWFLCKHGAPSRKERYS